MNSKYLRGEIYYADLGDCIGSEQMGHRPVVIVQNNIGNNYSPTVIVASITSKVNEKARIPTHCSVGVENGLAISSIILLEQLRTIDKKRLGDYIGRLTEKQLRSFNKALAISVGDYDPAAAYAKRI